MQQMRYKLSITSFPRIHLTLIGMNKRGYRINGGLGFALKEPRLNLEVRLSRKFKIRDNRILKLDMPEEKRLIDIVENVRSNYNFKNCIEVELLGKMPTHFGFGSCTAIRLACLESLFIINKLEYDKNLIIKLSGRGRTSGIGINTYFHGGFVLDIGHTGENLTLQSSSLSEERKEPALLMQRLKMPIWDIGICIPTKIKPKSEADEKIFFEKICPIPDQEVYKILYHAIYGLHASILDKNKENFGKALINIQGLAWKKPEREQYGDDLLELENCLYQSGASAVGMSSLGPCLFFFANDISNIIKKMQVNKMPCILMKTKPINRGRIISYV